MNKKKRTLVASLVISSILCLSTIPCISPQFECFKSNQKNIEISHSNVQAELSDTELNFQNVNSSVFDTGSIENSNADNRLYLWSNTSLINDDAARIKAISKKFCEEWSKYIFTGTFFPTVQINGQEIYNITTSPDDYEFFPEQGIVLIKNLKIYRYVENGTIIDSSSPVKNFGKLYLKGLPRPVINITQTKNIVKISDLFEITSPIANPKLYSIDVANIKFYQDEIFKKINGATQKELELIFNNPYPRELIKPGVDIIKENSVRFGYDNTTVSITGEFLCAPEKKYNGEPIYKNLTLNLFGFNDNPTTLINDKINVHNTPWGKLDPIGISDFTIFDSLCKQQTLTYLFGPDVPEMFLKSNTKGIGTKIREVKRIPKLGKISLTLEVSNAKIDKGGSHGYGIKPFIINIEGFRVNPNGGEIITPGTGTDAPDEESPTIDNETLIKNKLLWLIIAPIVSLSVISFVSLLSLYLVNNRRKKIDNLKKDW